jgi:hypothetical protein
MAYGVVVPSRLDSNLASCLAAMRASGETATVRVVDDGLSGVYENVKMLPGVKPFIFSRNVNIGIRDCWAAGCDGVVVCNDDAELQTPGGFAPLAVKRDGVTSAAVTAVVGNPRQKPQGKGIRSEAVTLAFVCVHIPREVWDKVGEFDERFTAYGGEDRDYCVRTKLAGLKMWISDDCVVRHGTLPSTFRGFGSRDITETNRIFAQKWAGRRC